MKAFEMIQGFAPEVTIENNGFALVADYSGEDLPAWELLLKDLTAMGYDVAAVTPRQLVLITQEMRNATEQSFKQALDSVGYGYVVGKLHQDTDPLSMDELAAVAACSAKLAMCTVAIPDFTNEAAKVVICTARSLPAESSVNPDWVYKFVTTYNQCVQVFNLGVEIDALEQRLALLKAEREMAGTELEMIGKELTISNVLFQLSCKQHTRDMVLLSLR